jgi:hypothetical protein
MTPLNSNKLTELKSKRDKLVNKQSLKISKLSKIMTVATAAVTGTLTAVNDSNYKNDLIGSNIHINENINWNDYYDPQGVQIKPLPAKYSNGSFLGSWVHSLLQTGVYGLAGLNAAIAIDDFKEDKKKAKLAGKLLLHSGIALTTGLLSDYALKNYDGKFSTDTISYGSGPNGETGLLEGELIYKSYPVPALISGVGDALELIILSNNYISAKITGNRIEKLNKNISLLEQYQSLFDKVKTNPTESDYKLLGEAIIAKYPKIKKKNLYESIGRLYSNEEPKSYKKEAKKIYNEITSAGLEKIQFAKLIIYSIMVQ